MENVKLWMRLGATLSVTTEQAKKILSGDFPTLKTALKEGEWYLDGHSYIPQIIVEEFQEQLGLNPDESSFDVDFDIAADFSVVDGRRSKYYGV